MLKKFIYLLLSLVLMFKIGALEVDRSSIELDFEVNIEFENYVGPYLFINSVDEIRQIGSILAAGITPETKSDATYEDKYFLYHRPKAEWEKELKSADIFHIGEKALIDHIDNIELILSEYLIKNYGYTKEDGDLLAHLITLYNAVYRGDVEHYGNSYSSEAYVTENSDNLGLDLHYSNWPGISYLYIPLSSSIYIGRLNTVDSDEIIDDKVISLLTEKNEDSIELREDIVDLKEREFDELKAELLIDLESLQELEALLVDKKATEDITAEEIEQLESVIEDKKSEIEEKVEEIEEKEETILELRDDLAEDKAELVEEVKKSSKLDTFNFILTKNVGDETLGQIVKVDTEGSIKTRSSVNSVRNRFIIKSGDRIYFIAGGDRANQKITLGSVKADTLNDPKWAEVTCDGNSSIIMKNNKLYTIINVQGNYYLGEFGFDLSLIRRSILTVEPESYIVYLDDKFYVQADNNSIKLVNLSDFTTEIE